MVYVDDLFPWCADHKEGYRKSSFASSFHIKNLRKNLKWFAFVNLDLRLNRLKITPKTFLQAKRQRKTLLNCCLLPGTSNELFIMMMHHLQLKTFQLQRWKWMREVFSLLTNELTFHQNQWRKIKESKTQVNPGYRRLGEFQLLEILDFLVLWRVLLVLLDLKLTQNDFEPHTWNIDLKKTCQKFKSTLAFNCCSKPLHFLIGFFKKTYWCSLKGILLYCEGDSKTVADKLVGFLQPFHINIDETYVKGEGAKL